MRSLTHIVEQDLHSASHVLLAASRLYGAALGARTLPLLAVLCVPASSRRLSALGWSVFVLSASSVLFMLDPSFMHEAVILALVLGYYLFATSCCIWFTRSDGPQALRPDVLFSVLAMIFLVLPVPFLRFFGRVEYLGVGWHITLSVYSCCIETRRSSQVVPLRSFLFFTLVDPTVSFLDRALPSRVARLEVAKRFIQGAALVCMAHALLRAHAYWTAAREQEALRVPGLLALPAAVLVVFFSIYWTRAGVAHVRIGMMQTLGLQPPECFDHPYRATSPLDFWRRWNIWVGDWVRRYLFIPFSLFLLRRGRATPFRQLAASALAVLGSFIAIGLLHDWLIFANLGAPIFTYLRAFAFAAAALLAWEAVAARRYARKATRPTGRLAQVPATFGVATYICAMLVLLNRV